MQKLVKRSSYAKKYAERKLAKQKVHDDRMYMVKDRMEQSQATVGLRKIRKQQHQERWEHTYRGQLAPRYDSGAQAEKYGTVTSETTTARRVPEKKRVLCPFAIDDRVVVVGSKYRDRGKIGKILDIENERQSVKLDGVEMAALYQPPFLRTLTQSPASSIAAPVPISFKDVRLVFPLVHPETGVLRDVVINEIDVREPFSWEKRAGIDKPVRSIAGVTPVVELPYPEEKEPQYNDHDCDTLRIEAEERTWVPTLGVPPMPPNIIDELRHKYSVFRTRYDDEFIAKREAAAQRAADKQKALKLAAKTPFDEINLAKRDKLREMNAKASEGGAWVPLSPEIIEGIARMALEAEAKTGRKLPAKTREQFQLIQQGFTDDPVEELVNEQENDDGSNDEFQDEDALDVQADSTADPRDKANP